VINLNGICELTTTHALPRSEWVDGFRIHLTSPGDLIIVGSPSWWTQQRLITVLAVAAGLGILAMTWIWILRRQVVAQTKIIGGQIQRGATLQERQRIARELHDSIEQEMAGVAIQISNARRRLAQDATQADSALTLAQEMIRHCREEARSSIRDLRSVALEQGGLPWAIKELLTPAAAEANIKLTLAVQGEVVRLDGRLESDLLRVAQEAVANSIHHASPSKIEITLDYGPDFVTLTVQDDGCGFDASSAPRRGHFGLLGMQERANQQHARLNIESRPGAGTKVSLRTPAAFASNRDPKETYS
jgi:signal transduction histidine kinase